MKKTFKVLLVAPYDRERVGGIGTWTRNLLDWCAASPDPIDVVFMNTVAYCRKNIGRTGVYRLVSGIFDSAYILGRLFFNLLFRRPKIVHYTSSGSLALSKDMVAVALCHLFGVRVVMHWHFGRIPALFEAQGKEYHWLVKVIRKADWNIVLDRRSLRVLQGNGFQNVGLLPNPVSAEMSREARQPSSDAGAYGDVIFLGHVIPTKGLRELVAACAGLPELKCLWVVGPYEADFCRELQATAAARDNGTWLKFTGELPRETAQDYLRGARLLALPSYTEGFPYAVLESMSLGRPVVATDVGSIEEMLEPKSDSPCGICVEVGAIDELREAIGGLLRDSDMCRTMAGNARGKVLREYTPDAVFARLISWWHCMAEEQWEKANGRLES